MSSVWRETMSPSIALKFMRNGVPSANLLAMHSLDGTTESGDFFEKDLSNHVARPVGMKAKMLAAKFIGATTYV
jgi:hypothetical protein